MTVSVSKKEDDSQWSTGTIKSPTLAKHSQTKQLWKYLESAKKKKKGYIIIPS